MEQSFNEAVGRAEREAKSLLNFWLGIRRGVEASNAISRQYSSVNFNKQDSQYKQKVSIHRPLKLIIKLKLISRTIQF
jgi:hypothetical protein